MKIGILKKRDSVLRAMWLALPPIARWALIAKRTRFENATLADLNTN